MEYFSPPSAVPLQNGKIDGAEKFGMVRAIPEDIVKPTRTGILKPGRKPKDKNETRE
jgi:hypothetical protein